MGKLWKLKGLTIRELTRRIGRGNWLLAVEVLDVAARQTTRYDVRAFNTALSVCKVGVDAMWVTVERLILVNPQLLVLKYTFV